MTCASKRCWKCGVEQPPASFCKDRTRRDGLATTCKACQAARSKARNARATADRRAAKLLEPPKPTQTSQKCWMCSAVLPLSSFHKDRTQTTGHSRCCKACARVRYAKWIKSGSASSAAYRSRRRRQSKEAVQSLSDAYLRRKIVRGTRLLAAEVPRALVELKRLQIQILRAVKEVKS